MRKVIVLVVATAALAAGVGGASAQPIDCGSFARIQTYRGWGPSLHYGRAVTVVYGVEECSASWTDDTFEYSVTGSATIHDGVLPEGRHPGLLPVIESRVFTTEGSFVDPDRTGWPPAWWSCLTSAEILWRIDGIYSFRAGATSGDWTLAISVLGAKPFRWAYSAC
ncbi:MAG TPA: hypothetical protein VF097_11325 [Actinomycetota bacterium]